MPVHRRTPRGPWRSAPIRPRLELLENRLLLSTTPGSPTLVPVQALPGNETLNQAQILGQLQTRTRVEVTGAIGTGAAGAADVDWFRFSLAQPANVALAAAPGASQPGPVLSLYNNDPSDPADTSDPLGHRQLAQAQSTASLPATITSSLAAGTYFVAVSGAGNRYFNPFLQGSGYPGSPCNYLLDLTTTDLSLPSGSGPIVLASTPTGTTPLGRSPSVIRLDLSAPLNSSTILSGTTVKLTFNATGNFGPADPVITLSKVNYSAQANELQLFPAAALAPGFYMVWLAGNSSLHPKVIKGLSGTPLGATSSSPQGQDYNLVFQVAGIENNGTPGTADDTPATSHQVGDLTRTGLEQFTGSIGDDPAYNPKSRVRTLANRAADVDLYHFEITGSGRYALAAEVFAGRIGSSLDPALSLFQVDTAGQLQLIGENDNSLNTAEATNGSVPLFTDPVLYAGLTAGDYYLAVSSSGNMPAPDAPLGVNGIFNPMVSHSGFRGNTTGSYVLNLEAEAVSDSPRVVACSLTAGAELSTPLTSFTVQFNKPMNLGTLTDQTFTTTSTTELAAVYVRGSDGVDYHPRLVSYDNTTGQATFLMLDALPNGPAELHLSGAGPLGLTDLAGNPLLGNPNPAGDYLVPFSVWGPSRGSPGNPLLWLSREPNNRVPQQLGVLFPHELQAGVVVERASAGSGAHDTVDYFAITVLQSRDYFVDLNGPADASLTLTDVSGNQLTGVPQGLGGEAFRFTLDPGTYIVGVGGWTPAEAGSVQYQLTLTLAASADNPPPLTLGPAPAIRLRFADPFPVQPATGGVVGAAQVQVQEQALVTLPSVNSAFLIEEEAASNILLTRALSPTGVRSEDSSVGDFLADRVLVRADELFFLQFAQSVLLSHLIIAPLDESLPQPLAEVQPTKPNSDPEQAPTQLALAPELIRAPQSSETSGVVALVTGMPSTALLDVLFESNPLSNSFAARARAAGRLPDGILSAALLGLGGTSPEQSEGSAVRWIDLLAASTICVALGLTGWWFMGQDLRRRWLGPDHFPTWWTDEDSRT